MHPVYILYFILFLHTQCVYAQIQGHYSCKVDKKRNISLDLSLYPNNFYSLTWSENEVADILTVGYISCGNWYIDQEKIILKDLDHNFQTTCTYRNIYLFGSSIDNSIEITIKDSFKWLIELKFTKYFEMDNDEKPDLKNFPFDSNFNPSLAKKEREKYYSDKERNTLFFGEYGENGYQLCIQPNHSYILNAKLPDFDRKSGKLKFKYLFRSEGTWERKGNVLTLFDTSVKCPFYLIITKDGLKPNQMMYSIHELPYFFRYMSR